MNNTPYEAVSMAVILRDWADNLPYKNDEHKRLTDIADTLWNAEIPVEEWADNPDYDYKALYARYGKQYWQKVMNDIDAIDSQVTRENVNDLADEYQELITC